MNTVVYDNLTLSGQGTVDTDLQYKLISSEPQLLHYDISIDLAIAAGASIRQIMVHCGGQQPDTE